MKTRSCHFLRIEEPLDEDGTTTPDLVTRITSPEEPESGLIITDYKTHFEIDLSRAPYKLRDRIVEAPRQHQFLDYIYRVEGYYREPVRLFRVLHIIFQPEVVVKETSFRPDPLAQAEWLRSARRKWHMMTLLQIDPALAYRNENGCMQYGEKYACPQMTACWDLHGDQERMTELYTQESK